MSRKRGEVPDPGDLDPFTEDVAEPAGVVLQHEAEVQPFNLLMADLAELAQRVIQVESIY
jgi:hypothetical protein